MLRPAGGNAPPLPAGLEIRPVDAANVDVFLRTLVEAYPMPQTPATVDGTAWLADNLRLLVGYLDGEPVGTAGANLAHGIVEVDWVSTYQRMGYLRLLRATMWHRPPLA